MANFYLPSKGQPEAVRQALREAHQDAAGEQSHLAMFWAFSHFFMRGLRNINAVSQIAGSPSLPTRDDKQRRRVRCEKVLVQASVEMGRILGIDLEPAVKRRPGTSLDTIREDSMSQAVLDECGESMLSPQLKLAQAYQLVTYGTVGGIVDQQAHPSLGWRPTVCLCPAWELWPLPGAVAGTNEIGGITRRRYVPLGWLRQRFKGVLSTPRKLDDQQIQELAFGKNPQPDGSPLHYAPAMLGGSVAGSSFMRHSYGAGDAEMRSREASTKYAELAEHWVFAAPNAVSRYILQLGDMRPFLDFDFTDSKWQSRLGNELPVPPIHVGRYMEIGSFWGRGFVDRQIPINREMEYLLADWLDNLRTVDRLRFLSISRTFGINTRQLAEARKNKVVFYAPDASAPTLKPEVIGPPNSGDAMGKTIGLLSNILDENSAQGEMLYGGVPKRLESARALAVVGQYQNVPVAMVAESLDGMWSGIWRAALGFVRHQGKFLQKEIVLQARRLDEMAVGLNPAADGTVRLADFPLPAPRNLAVTIRSKQPVDNELRVQRLQQYIESEWLTRVEAMIELVREGIEGPRISRAYYYNYVNAWLENAIMFGDGEVPGTVRWNQHSENHIIHFTVADELLQSPLLKAASDQVRRVVLEHRNYHLSFLPHLPEGATPLDQLGAQPVPPGMMQQLGGMPPAGMDTGLDTIGSTEGPQAAGAYGMPSAPGSASPNLG